MPDTIIELVCQIPNERLDKFLAASIPALSRTQAKQLIKTGQVQAAGLRLKPNTFLPVGTHLTVTLPVAASPQLEAQDIPLDILFADTHLVVINKPAGLPVHPGAGHPQNTLVNGLIKRYPEMTSMDPQRPGVVHRLDKDTSGVIVAARNKTALQHLQEQFKTRSAKKIYLALIYGHPQVIAGTIDVPIERHPQHRQRMAPRSSGKPARTHYKVLKTFDHFSLIELILETGRTHQIRVHLAWLGHPVVGDLHHTRGGQASAPTVHRTNG